MSDPIRSKLSAYLDGELDSRAQSEVRAHLVTCRACQEELDELTRLSRLLHAAPLPEFTPAHVFKAQLMLQLPRREDAGQPERSNGRLLPWLLPAAGLAGWIFLQATFLVSWVVSIAGQAGILDGAAAWFNTDPGQVLWIGTARAALSGILSPQGQSGLSFLNDTGIFTQNLLIALLLQVGVAFLYLGALALLWHTLVRPLWPSSLKE